MTASERNWCAIYSWPDKSPFYLGTVSLRLDATNHEVEQALDRVLQSILPDGFDLPKMIELIPGSIVLNRED